MKWQAAHRTLAFSAGLTVRLLRYGGFAGYSDARLAEVDQGGVDGVGGEPTE